MNRFSRFLLPFLGGMILTLSFAPYNLYFMAWVAFLPLFYSLRNNRHSFRKGFMMGLGFFATLLYWIPFSRVEPGIRPQMTAGYILLLGYLALYFGFSSVLFTKLKRINKIYIFPLVFAGIEFIRSLSSVFGFPWGSLGYSQTGLTDFIQIASIGGVPAVTAWLVGLNVALYLIIRNAVIERKNIRMHGVVLLLLFLIPYGYSRIVKMNGVKKNGKIAVSIIQPNVLPHLKRSRSSERYRRIERMIEKSPSSEIYILPETASPSSLRHSERALEFFKNLSGNKSGIIVTGMPDFKLTKGVIHHYNSAVTVDSTGVRDFYRKMYLVPFVERLPLDDVIPGLSKIHLGQGHFTPGSRYTVFRTDGSKFSVSICYEAIFPQLLRKFVRGGAEFLVNITEDGWFGETSAPYQHAEMAVFHSITFRKPLLRCANTGVSLITTPFGVIKKKTDIFTEEILSAEINKTEGQTIFTKVGNLFGYLCIITAGIFIFAGNRRNDKEAES